MKSLNNILSVWNRNFPLDVTTEEVLRSKFFESPYSKRIDPVENDGAFSLACTRAKPFGDEVDSDRGWVLWIGYDGEKNARELLFNQFEKFRERGIRKITFSGFTPDYFLPGIDRQRYPGVYNFLKQLGFKDSGEAIAMSSDLRSFNDAGVSDSDRIVFKSADVEDRDDLYEFLRKNFGPDWIHRAMKVHENGEREQIYMAKHLGKVVGFSMFSGSEGDHWYTPGERFGPFGVQENMRGRGIGASLLNRTMLAMKGRGIRTAYFLWTDEKAKRLYSRFGFQVERRFTIMEKKLE